MTAIVDSPLPPAARLALDGLTAELAARQQEAAPIVGLADASAAVQAALAEAGVDCPAAPESLVICRLGDTLVLAGRDDLGLAYAIAEARCALVCAMPNTALVDAVADTRESPALTWRSMEMFLCCRDLEVQWYFDDGFWCGYLDQLRDCRYNNFSLTFGHQTWYLTPPYPYHLAVPGFPGVQVDGLRAAERQRNLAALRRIGELTRARGLHFTLGIWTQVPDKFGPSPVRGLTAENLVAYNAAGLRELLAVCTEIDGLQLRVNWESGISEDQQRDFFAQQLRAVAECGRDIRLDLRAKGMSDALIAEARRTVANTVVSTKFWCEHLAQPYAMPAIQAFDLPHYRRYGYWDLLAKPRATPLVYRLWTAGTQRILQWGSPPWAKRFCQAVAGHAEGFEVMAPLTNKGGLDTPGSWPLITDTELQPYPFEYQRYWQFYLLFGRLGYAPDSAPETWEREYRRHYGSAAAALLAGFVHAGEVMALLTTVLQWSASLWAFWPELFAGRTLKEDLTIEPSDPTQFYAVREYVGDALRGSLCGKWSPFHVAARLDLLATAIDQAVSGSATEDAAREVPAAGLDLRVQMYLARFHAQRLRCLTNLAFFLSTGDAARHAAATSQLQAARREWAALSRLTDGVYHHNLVFGRAEFRHHGHWSDRLTEIDVEMRYLSDIGGQYAQFAESAVTKCPGEDALPPLPAIHCELPARARSGQSLTLNLQIDGNVAYVLCHYRRMQQSLPFRNGRAAATGAGQWQVTIPGDAVEARWDLMVFFELGLGNGEARRWPDWRQRTPYHVIETLA